MAAKRPVRYTCTIRLVRDRKFGVWIKPLRVRWSRIMSAFFVLFLLLLLLCVCVCVWTPWGPWGNRWFNDLQYLASTKGNSSALVGDRSCTCVCFIVLLESLFLFLLQFVCLFLHFMVYSVETVTETFWALFLLFFLFPLPPPPPPPPRVFLLLFCGKLWRLFLFFLYNLFYITIIINQCKSWSLCGFLRQVLFSVWLEIHLVSVCSECEGKSWGVSNHS